MEVVHHAEVEPPLGINHAVIRPESLLQCRITVPDLLNIPQFLRLLVINSIAQLCPYNNFIIPPFNVMCNSDGLVELLNLVGAATLLDVDGMDLLSDDVHEAQGSRFRLVVGPLTEFAVVGDERLALVSPTAQTRATRRTHLSHGPNLNFRSHFV